ncbi:hypothetical protein BC739_002653 [Kutzneria viridogrisea]|uniref:Alpha/beta hydrolase family protein n=1 Tax=Kutzneria viridogrisea TaxID=47990 RepID=A0ABR6BF04_9PSEU|nr:hypothetical protein [Kutzneria viridogrisea]
MTRVDVTFRSHGTGCAAWLYRPERTDPARCAVMAHGLGAVRGTRCARPGWMPAPAGSPRRAWPCSPSTTAASAPAKAYRARWSTYRSSSPTGGPRWGSRATCLGVDAERVAL